MSITYNKNTAMHSAFALWLTEKLNLQTENDIYLSLCEADDFLLSHKISTKSIFELDQREVDRLLSKLCGNRIYRYKASVPIRVLQKATKLLIKFLKEQERNDSIVSVGKDFIKGEHSNEGMLVTSTKELLKPYLKEETMIVPTEKIAKDDEIITPAKNEAMTFDTLLAEDQYSLLRDALIRNGITKVEDLKKINLWTFMNRHSLYTIQTRFKIATELNSKLYQERNHVTDISTFRIHYSDDVFSGATPSEAFVAFLSYIATKYPLKFRSCISIIHPETKKVVVRRHDYEGKMLKLMCPPAYVDKDLTIEQVRLYVQWILQKCTATNPTFDIIAEEQPSIAKEGLDKPLTPVEIKEQDKPIYEKSVEPKKFQLSASFYTQQAEKYLLKKDLDGATYKELQAFLNTTMINTKATVTKSPQIIELAQHLYHVEAFVDFKEGADCIEGILDKLLKKNNGVVSATQLYEYVRIEIPMFLNDNGISEQQQIFDLARYLFKKIDYHNKHYCFRSNLYISLPETAVDSTIDIIKNYARDKGTIFTYSEIENYLFKMGLNTGSLRQRMRIGEEPIFFVYWVNEYLLGELIDMNDEFFDHIRKALARLFEDEGDHVIIRSISKNWYDLLPSLPTGLDWTPMLLQQMLHFYSKQLGARTIMAMDTQDSNTLHAMLVTSECWIHDFRDAVAAYLNENMPERTSFEAEELRQILVCCGMIYGNELIYNMPKALGSDPRFLWDSEGRNVSVRL